MPKSLILHKPGAEDRISEEGLYDVPLWRYHTDLCNAPSASSSELITLADSGEEYYETCRYNPNAPEPKPRPHFRFGSAAHSKILEPENWTRDYILRPESNWTTWKSQASREWRWIQEYRKGFIVITKAEIAHIDNMAERIVDHEEANALFAYGIPEVSMMIKVGGVWIKSRPDVLPIVPVVEPKKKSKVIKPPKFTFAADVLSDYKTIADNSETECRRAIVKWSYDMKLANVALAACRLFDLPFEDLSFGLVFQKSSAPYGITVVEIDPDGDYMHLLVAKCLYAAEKFGDGMAIRGEWLGYAEEILKYTPSGWFIDKLKNMVDKGIYPNLDSKLRIIKKD